MVVLVKRFGEHVVTVVVESRGLESHENRLMQSHPSDVGRVNVGGLESTGSWRCCDAVSWNIGVVLDARTPPISWGCRFLLTYLSAAGHDTLAAGQAGESWLTAAIPMYNPYCSCKLTNGAASAEQCGAAK